MIKAGLLIIAVCATLSVVYLFRTNTHKLTTSGSSITPTVLGQMTIMGQTVVPITENETELILKVGETKVIFSKQKDFGMQVRALQELLKQLRMNGHNIQIDLRFDKAVISNY